MGIPLDQWPEESGLLEFQENIRTHIQMTYNEDEVPLKEDADTLTRLVMISLRDMLRNGLPKQVTQVTEELSVQVTKTSPAGETKSKTLVEVFEKESGEEVPSLELEVTEHDKSGIPHKERPRFREDGDIVEFIEHMSGLGYIEDEIADEIVTDVQDPLRSVIRLIVAIRELKGIIQPGTAAEDLAKEYVTTRATNCADCGRPGKVQVTFDYNEGGKLIAANITGMEDGWKMQPYGAAGGEAPYCPVCLEKRYVT